MRIPYFPACITFTLLGALLCGNVLAVETQDKKLTVAVPAVSPVKTAVTPIDPRFRSPRATVRTFLIALNLAEDDPHRIEEAIACLDLSGLPPDRRNGGRLAFSLEFILRSTNIPTIVIPDFEEGQECTIGENKDINLTLHRTADGRWLFNSKTLENLPKMRLFLWQRDIAANQGKETGDVSTEFRSPYAMYHTFVDSFKNGDLDTAARCLDLRDVPDPARQIVGRELAYKLKEILDRSVFIIFQDLPDTAIGTPLAALIHKEGRITVERQVEGGRKGQWLFNRATVRSLDRLYEDFERKPIVPELAETGRKSVTPPFGLAPGLWVRHWVPDAIKYRVNLAPPFALAIYQLLGTALLVLLIVPTYFLVIRILDRLRRALIRWRTGITTEQEVSTWIRPAGCLAVVWMLVRGVTLLNLPIESAGILLAILVPAFWLVAAFAVYQLIDPVLKLVVGPAVTTEGTTTLAAMGLPVISLVFKILVVTCGLTMILKLFEFDVATVLAGLGIGGLAVALAAQDTLKNFLGSLMLIADRTFHVGDLVQIGSNKGVVESVGLRTTRIRGLDDSLLTIPNSDLTTAHVTNFGARRYRRFRTRLIIAYGTPPNLLIQFRDGLLDLVLKNSSVRQQKFEVAVNDLAASGIEILVQVFFEVSDGRAELAARDKLILDILRLADELKISLDSKTVTVERERDKANGKLAGSTVPLSES